VDIAIGGCRVAHWHGRKGTQLLAYLLLNRGGPAVSRDALAAICWPDAPPDAARNRLHVAVHTLRADLQKAAPVPVVLFDHGYTINPELDVRLDTEVFERAAARGRRAEKDGDIDAALAAYREAAREYRGDLLSDHPYDDWTLLPREHYRVRMLDVLGRIVQITFDAGRYSEAVEAGQRLLALDFCREDLHRLLMRAYSRLGRPHLALHQFEVCIRQLRRDLDIVPAPETVKLYDRIRARSFI
jgi:DNA-binding SARP family transcriptional activator